MGDRRVLLLDLEEHPGDLANRLVDFGADPSRVFVLDRVGMDPVADLTRAVEAVQPSLVVVDTLPAFTAPLMLDSGNAAGWTPVMAGLSRIARESGAAILLLHHGNKSDGSYRDSTAIGAGVDVVLEMREGDEIGERKIRARGRLPMTDFTVRLVEGSRPRFELVTGELSLDHRVYRFMETRPGEGIRGVRDGVRGRSRAIDAAVGRLISAGAVVDKGNDQRHAYYVSTEKAHGHATDAVRTHGDGILGARALPSGRERPPKGGSHLGHTPQPELDALPAKQVVV